MSMKIFGNGSVFPHDPADDHVTSAGAGGSAKFIVNLIWVEQEEKYIVDKTCNEIVAAVKSGLDVQLVYRDVDYVSVYNFVYWDGFEGSHDVVFSSIRHVGDGMLNVTTYYVRSDNTVKELYSEFDINPSSNTN